MNTPDDTDAVDNSLHDRGARAPLHSITEQVSGAARDPQVVGVDAGVPAPPGLVLSAVSNRSEERKDIHF